MRPIITHCVEVKKTVLASYTGSFSDPFIYNELLFSKANKKSLEGWRHVLRNIFSPCVTIDGCPSGFPVCVQCIENWDAIKIPSFGWKTPPINIYLDYISAFIRIHH
jgi:hypothetical protein